MKLNYTKEEAYEYLFFVLRTFGIVSAELEKCIRERTDVITIKKGQVMIEFGEAFTSCFFSFSGYVKGYKLGSEKEELVEWFMGKGKIIIRPKKFRDGEPSDGYIEALEDLVAVELPYEHFVWLMENFPDFKDIYSKARDYYYDLSLTREEMKNHVAEENLARLVNDHPGILEKASVGDIASYLGITREHYTRVRKESKL